MRISFVVPNGAFLFGVIGPATVFSRANQLLGKESAYETEFIAASDSTNITGAAGTHLQADRILSGSTTAIDTLIVTGSQDLDSVSANQNFISWVARHASSARRVASVCTGAFVLASAGLLNGVRATTHFEFIKQFMEKYPAVKAEPGRLYVHEGKMWTSAGMAAGIDMALAMVEEDHGRDIAREIARLMNFHPRQPDTEFYAIPGGGSSSGRAAIQEIQTWVKENIAADLSVKAMASHARMSVRNFTRVFQSELSITPARFVDTVRVDAARHMLEGSRLPLKRIATVCGFVTIGRMRRAFRRHLGTTPQDYRQQLQTMLSERDQVAKQA
jgi:transcriptional regulator GlxA family with amidase domain